MLKKSVAMSNGQGHSSRYGGSEPHRLRKGVVNNKEHPGIVAGERRLPGPRPFHSTQTAVFAVLAAA